MGLWAYGVALAVYAYEADGAKAVGIVTLVRAIPAALSAPFTSTLADRLPRVPFLVATNLGRAAAIGAAGAVALAGGARVGRLRARRRGRDPRHGVPARRVGAPPRRSRERRRS